MWGTFLFLFITRLFRVCAKNVETSEFTERFLAFSLISFLNTESFGSLSVVFRLVMFFYFWHFQPQNDWSNNLQFPPLPKYPLPQKWTVEDVETKAKPSQAKPHRNAPIIMVSRGMGVGALLDFALCGHQPLGGDNFAIS